MGNICRTKNTEPKQESHNTKHETNGNELVMENKSLRKEEPKKEFGNTNHRPSNSELSCDFQSNGSVEVPRKEHIIGIISEHDARPQEKYLDSNWLYKMDNKYLGHAIIFNHYKFKYHETREGTYHDKERLESVLNKLGFLVYSFDDLNYCEICAVIKEIQNINHTDVDCLVVAVLSHGNFGGVLSAQDTDYPFSALWEPFTDDNCPTLAGKPRLFFIQACRGDDSMDPVELQFRTETDGTLCKTTVPNIPEHFLVAYATCEGYYSWRKSNGSWFIQTLCEKLEEYAFKYDLNFILTNVLREVAIGYESFNPNELIKHKKKQMPSVVTKLTHLLIFKRKA